VAGGTDANSTYDAFFWDRPSGTVTLMSHTAANAAAAGNGQSFVSSISGSGDFVVFESLASDLAPSDTNNGSDVFLWDRAAGTSTALSLSPAVVSSTPEQGVSFALPRQLSADGRYAVFFSESPHVVAGQTDTNDDSDVFLVDRTTGVATLVSHSTGSPSTAGNGESLLPWLSADGRWLAFSSAATDLLNGVTDTNNNYDAFLYDRTTGTTALLSHKASSLTETSAGRSYAVGLSPGGGVVALLSAGSDLMTGLTDLNDTDDLFLVEPAAGAVELMSRTPAGTAIAGNGSAYFYPSFSDNGSVVLFPSYASDLVEGDHNLSLDVFPYLRGMEYYTLTPCRLFDTRQPPDGPALPSGITVSLQPLGACGIPPTARALALNLTVTGGTGSGHLILFPGGTVAPGTSAINFSAGATRANNAILSLRTDGTLSVKPFVSGAGDNGTVHVLLDVAGYFQ
jgi:Tol biopolymer transport system component